MKSKVFTIFIPKKFLSLKTFPLVIVAFVIMTFIWVGCGGATRSDTTDNNKVSITSMVLVETDRQEYQQNEEVVVTITNNLDISITTIDQQAFCTIIRLDQQIGKEWKEVRNCFSGMPSRDVTLGAHSKTIMKLSGLSPGTYRAYIKYSLGVAYNLGKSYISSAPQFIVQLSRKDGQL